jgi:hypothetical protein
MDMARDRDTDMDTGIKTSTDIYEKEIDIRYLLAPILFSSISE